MAQHLAPSTASANGLSLRRDELPDIELQLLLDALLRYGSCDFRVFNQSVLRRRVADAMRAENVSTITGLIDRLLHDERAFASFVTSIKAPAAQPFFDPGFYRSFSANVIPLLRTYSFVRIWVPTAGPSASAYALAALLAEARLIEKTIIYATFINDPSVSSVKAGLRHGGRDQLESNARASGLGAPVSEYFDVDEEFAVPRGIIKENVMLARHNPASDASINEFHAIIARGFAPLLNGSVQYRLHALMYESLTHLGFLAMGGGENITHTPHETAFRQVAADQPIYRRLR